MSAVITKPYNQLQPGDVVTRVYDPAFPEDDVTFVRPFTVTETKTHQGKTIFVRIDRSGAFWTPRVVDRRVAVLL